MELTDLRGNISNCRTLFEPTFWLQVEPSETRKTLKGFVPMVCCWREIELLVTFFHNSPILQQSYTFAFWLTILPI
jgi:hypothetical protein